MNINRRNFLKSGSLALSALGLNMAAPVMFQRKLMAAPGLANKKMIFIFQEGGNDGVNTVIPRGDSEYNTRTRPTLYIPPGEAIASGNGFANFHPALSPMMEIYNQTGINGQEGPGNLAVLHRIGYDGQSRSHFNSQHYWQNGMPGDSETEEGFIYRHLNRNVDLNAPENAFVAAGLSGSQLVALKGPNTIPNFSRASRFDLPAGDKFLGRRPEIVGGSGGKGLLGLYGGPADDVGKRYRNLVHSSGQTLGAALTTVKGALDQGTYQPENGADYPDNRLGDKLREAAMLMKRTDVRVIGMRIGGWDTHKRQGQINGSHANLLGTVAQGFQAIYRDMQSQWEDLIVVTMTEFGRTSKENGSAGTDHAESSVMFVGGGGVKGGVYNCDETTWSDGDMFSKRDRYVEMKTDFRSVFGEIFQGHFGDDPRQFDEIIPGYTFAKLDNPSDFSPLNFMRA